MFFYWISYQTLLLMKTGSILSASRVYPLSKLCQTQIPILYVRDSVVLYAHRRNLIPHFSGSNNFSAEYRHDSRMHCKAIFDSLSPEVWGFLVNIENNLPTHQQHCSAWDVLFKRKSAKHTFKIGCTRYISTFFQKPMSVSFLPAALNQLINVYRRNNPAPRDHKTSDVIPFLDLFSVTITAVSFNCGNPRNKFWVHCPQGLEACIQPQLFCDGFNNCGLWEEERGCKSAPLEFPANLSASASRKSRKDNEEMSTTVSPLPVTYKTTYGYAYTEKGRGSDPAVPTSPVDTAGVTMVLGFFIFLGKMYLPCCMRVTKRV